MKKDFLMEYSYLVATNTDKTVTNYNPFVIAHPQMDKCNL